MYEDKAKEVIARNSPSTLAPSNFTWTRVPMPLQQEVECGARTCLHIHLTAEHHMEDDNWLVDEPASNPVRMALVSEGGQGLGEL